MKTEQVCPRCGEALGRIEQRSWQSDVKPEWHSAHFCANPDCPAYLETIVPPKGLGIKKVECRKEDEKQ